MHKTKPRKNQRPQGSHAPSATSLSQPAAIASRETATDEQFNALMPEVNGAIVDFRRITKFAAKAACTVGEKLAELRKTFGHDYQWLAAVRRRFGLSANEVWFFHHFFEQHGAQKDRLEPVVDVKLSELLAMIADAWVAVETRSAGIAESDRNTGREDDAEVEEETEDEDTAAEEEEEEIDIEDEDIEVEDDVEDEEDIEIEDDDEAVRRSSIRSKPKVRVKHRRPR